MYRHRLFQSMLIVALLTPILASSPTTAAPPVPGENVHGIGGQSVPVGPVLSHSSLPGSVAASAPAGAAPSGTGDVRINEVMFHPGAGEYEWVELKNAGSDPVNIGGYGITDEDGNWYKIPDALPDVPAGAFVVVVFDELGSGSDETDFGDDVATLHSAPGLVDIFEDDADQCALYTYSAGDLTYLHLPLVTRDYASWNPPLPEPETDLPTPPVIAFVAWGAEPGDEASTASAAGLWSEDWYVGLARGIGEESPDLMLAPNESIGLFPDSQSGYLDDWTLFQAGEVTRGAENAYPAISWSYPAPGATVDSETFAVIWNAIAGATGYRFQMDDNSDFGSPEEDTTLTQPAYTPTSPVPEGTYYWRVKVIFAGGQSSWSPGTEIASLALPSPTASASHTAALAYKTLGITWQLQHKDTNMLCLDGCQETGNSAWDGPHANMGTHGSGYCVRASMSMMASYYGGRLSQDRISYEIFKGGGPEGDLGHGRGVPPPPDLTETNTLSWTLGVNVPVQAGKPTFAQIKGWIDADRPIMARIPGHMRVIDGYLEFSILGKTWEFIHLLDPLSRATLVAYADDNIAHVWVGPAGTTGAPNVRSDEDMDNDGTADTMDDSDGDGICDFDERNRFSSGGQSLSHTDSDSDDDLVPDKLDIREYLFTNAGAHKPKAADRDNDGRRKEVDPDNDSPKDDGIIDGCEDGNHNGKYEPTLGETNNFDPSDDMTLHVRLSWPQLGSDVDLHLIKPGAEMWSAGDCYFANRNPDWGTLGNNCDDPRLDVDCISTCTVENIRLSKLENGIYNVKVHYYWDHGLGPTSPTVWVYLQGVRYDFGPRQMTDDQVWHVCTIDSSSRTLTPGSGIAPLSRGESLSRPGK